MKQRIGLLGLCLSLLMLLPVAQAAVSIEGPLTHKKVIEPGQTYRGAIQVRNSANKMAEVRVYQRNYLSNAKGERLYLSLSNKKGAKRSNAHWISFRPEILRVPPKSVAAVHYIVRVPKSRHLEGTYWSVLMVEPIPESSPLSSKKRKKEVSVGIQQVMRFAIQMVSQIGDTGTGSLKLSNPRMYRDKADGDKRKFNIDIANNGSRWLVPLVWIDIFDTKGRHIGKFEGNQRRLYPGTSLRFTVDLSTLPKGRYRGLLIADAGEGEVYGSNISITVK